MPVNRPVVAIDIDDSAIKNFLALTDKYREALSKLPGSWGQIGKSVGAVKTDFGEMTAALLAQQELLHKTSREAEQFGKHVTVAGRGFQSMTRDARELVRHVASITEKLVKWSAISGLIGGGAGLFGLDRLAGAAGGLRREASGLGVRPTALQAWNATMQPLVNPANFLSNLANSLSDLNARPALYGLGLGFAQGNAADIGPTALRRIWGILQRTPQAMTAQVLQSYGLDRLIDLPTARRLKTTSRGELEEDLQAAQQFERKTKLPDETLRNWQRFNRQLYESGTLIENAFIIGLSPLVRAGVLPKLSQAFTDMVSNLLKSKAVGELVDTVAEGLKSAAAWLGDDKNVKKITDGFEEAGRQAWAFAKMVGDATGWVRRNFGYETDDKKKQRGKDAQDKWEKLTPEERQRDWDWYRKGGVGPFGPQPTPEERNNPIPPARSPFAPRGSSGGGFQPTSTYGDGAGGGDGSNSPARRRRPAGRFGGMSPGGMSPISPTSAEVPAEAQGLLKAIALRESEGAAARLGVSPYNVRYTPGGGAAFSDLSHHPRIYERTPTGELSSAAGRYQFVWRTWMGDAHHPGIAQRLGLKDFSAASQDKAAWYDAQQVYKRAVHRDLANDLRHGYFDPRAVGAFHREWSSFGPKSIESIKRYSDKPAVHGVSTAPTEDYRRPADRRDAGLYPRRGDQSARVDIYNNTGGSAVISSSQIA
jgi:muramidase (phage lysozyme)